MLPLVCVGGLNPSPMAPSPLRAQPPVTSGPRRAVEPTGIGQIPQSLPSRGRAGGRAGLQVGFQEGVLGTGKHLGEPADAGTQVLGQILEAVPAGTSKYPSLRAAVAASCWRWVMTGWRPWDPAGHRRNGRGRPRHPDPRQRSPLPPPCPVAGAWLPRTASGGTGSRRRAPPRAPSRPAAWGSRRSRGSRGPGAGRWHRWARRATGPDQRWGHLTPQEDPPSRLLERDELDVDVGRRSGEAQTIARDGQPEVGRLSALLVVAVRWRIHRTLRGYRTARGRSVGPVPCRTHGGRLKGYSSASNTNMFPDGGALMGVARGLEERSEDPRVVRPYTLDGSRVKAGWCWTTR